MGTLILMIIIIAVIYAFSRRTAGNAKKKTGTQSDGRKTADSNRPDSGNKPAKPNRPNPGTKPAKPNRPNPGTNPAKPNRPDPGKKTTGSKRPAYAGTMAAKQNVPPDRGRQERFDAYKKQKAVGQTDASEAYRRMKEADISAAAEADAPGMRIRCDRDAAADTDLMREVYDAIILGPKDTVAFRRDFVAEGVDFLNRYTL